MCGSLSDGSTECPETLVLHWVGDIGLSGQLCNPQHHESIKDNMSRLANEAGQHDLLIGNFEAPLWGDGGINKLKMPRLCTTIEAARCILPLGLDVVLMANNHVYDCLEGGFENTREFLEKNNIQYLGAGTEPAEAARPLILSRKGMRIGILNYVGPETHPNIPKKSGVFLNMFEEQKVLTEIGDLAKSVDVLLLNLHWGSEELVRYPAVEQRVFARNAVECGATVVACSHAHCLQGHEYWKQGHIFYGLGNFIFGDIDDWSWPDLARRTALAIVVVSRRGVEKAMLRPLYQEGFTLQWDSRPSRMRMERKLNRYLGLSEKTCRLIYAWERFYQKVIVSYFRFVKRSGGFIPSLLQIRKRHLGAVARITSGRT